MDPGGPVGALAPYGKSPVLVVASQFVPPQVYRQARAEAGYREAVRPKSTLCELPPASC